MGNRERLTVSSCWWGLIGKCRVRTRRRGEAWRGRDGAEQYQTANDMSALISALSAAPRSCCARSCRPLDVAPLLPIIEPPAPAFRVLAASKPTSQPRPDVVDANSASCASPVVRSHARSHAPEPDPEKPLTAMPALLMMR